MHANADSILKIVSQIKKSLVKSVEEIWGKSERLKDGQGKGGIQV